MLERQIMLTRIYVDNFRCLVNFELKLDRLNLLMGENGSGKTTVFEVLRRLQRFLVNRLHVDEAFPSYSLTRWQQVNTQKFEIELTVDKDVYCYSVAIEHDRNAGTRKIQHEKLLINQHPLLVISEGNLRVDDKDSSSILEVAIPGFPLSYVSLLQEWPEGALVTPFLKQIARMAVVRPFPIKMNSESAGASRRLALHGRNFASWFRYLSEEHHSNILEVEHQLREVIPGFESFDLKVAGEKTKVLKVLMRNATDAKPVAYNFSELSDGQRQLILLYTLLYGVKGEGYCLFLDEPDNFLALREIQPWLMTLHDACGDAISQAVIISHHPEIMDYLATSAGQWFERQDDGRVQVHGAPLPVGGLKISETIARGWNE
jgi:predicted ATPase